MLCVCVGGWHPRCGMSARGAGCDLGRAAGGGGDKPFKLNKMSEVRASARARRLCLRVGKSRVGRGRAAEYFGWAGEEQVGLE